MVHAASATEKISVASTTKADEKVDDKPNGDNSNGDSAADAGTMMVVPYQPLRSPDILVDASSPSPNSEEEVVQADDAGRLVQKKGVKEDSKTIIIDLSVPSFKSAGVVDGLDNLDEAKTNGDEISCSNRNHVNGVVEDDDEEEKVDSKAQALETEEETDKGQYVGDGSWEEKTWKELVRLREDMFWARIGGIRG